MHFWNLGKDLNLMLFAMLMIPANSMIFFILQSRMEKIEMSFSKPKGLAPQSIVMKIFKLSTSALSIPTKLSSRKSSSRTGAANHRKLHGKERSFLKRRKIVRTKIARSKRFSPSILKQKQFLLSMVVISVSWP